MSIESNELRLGNYALDAKGGLHEIINGWQIDEGDELFGIPLTTNLLDKLGFKQDDVGFSQQKIDALYYNKIWVADIGGVFKLWITCEDDYYSHSWTEFKYLHQLQNCFFFLSGGTELEINI